MSIINWLKTKKVIINKSIFNSKHGYQNCWEYKKCGREVDGCHVDDLGVCPAYPNHGRYCWTITETLCDKKVQGTFAAKKLHCMECKFLNKVREEEDQDFTFIDIDESVENK